MENITATSGNSLIGCHLEADLFHRWTSYIDAKPRTIESYSRSIRQFIFFLRTNGISQPTRADIMAYRDSLKADHKPATVQAYLQAVKLFFKWTAQEGLYPDIADRVKGAKLDNDHKKDPLTITQTRDLLGAIEKDTLAGLRDNAIITLMLTSGLRTIEISRANVEDLRTVADNRVLFIQGKGHEEKSEYIKVADQAERAIRSYLKARGSKDIAEPLFTSLANRNKGKRLTTKSISRIVKEHLITAGLESDRLTAHSLRHTFATQNLLNGGTIEETQQALRHQNINTTLIYSHALERINNNSEARVAEAIFG